MAQDESASAADRAVSLIFEGTSLAFFFAPAEALINGGSNYSLYILGWAIGIALAITGAKWRSWKDREAARKESSSR